MNFPNSLIKSSVLIFHICNEIKRVEDSAAFQPEFQKKNSTENIKLKQLKITITSLFRKFLSEDFNSEKKKKLIFISQIFSFWMEGKDNSESSRNQRKSILNLNSCDPKFNFVPWENEKQGQKATFDTKAKNLTKLLPKNSTSEKTIKFRVLISYMMKLIDF